MSAIMTRSHIMFDPLLPDPALIDIRDIAHSLSMLCRANGHFQSFYSVGQHCINCCNEAAARGYSRRVQLACLLHDGSEAYLSDVTRPVKEELPRYKQIEEPLQEIIWMGESFLKGNQGFAGLVWPLFFTGIYYLIFNGIMTILLGQIEKKLDYYKG